MGVWRQAGSSSLISCAYEETGEVLAMCLKFAAVAVAIHNSRSSQR